MTAQADSASSLGAPSAVMAARKELRQQMRQQRRSMPAARKVRAAIQLARQFDRQHLLRPGLRIALYLAMPEELSLQLLITRAQQRGCQLFVPDIVNARRRRMRFVPLRAATRLGAHRWGMPQICNPSRSTISLRQLDLVLLPTVAFDARGHRLGMGAGFYDRYLACLRGSAWRPRLLGVAYALQQAAAVPALPHDIPLPAIITEHGLMRCR